MPDEKEKMSAIQGEATVEKFAQGERSQVQAAHGAAHDVSFAGIAILIRLGTLPKFIGKGYASLDAIQRKESL